MFKKANKGESKNTNVRNVKALLGKCMSTRDVVSKFHSRSLLDCQDSKRDQNHIPLSTTGDTPHSQSHFAFTAKEPLRDINLDLNRSHSKGRLCLKGHKEFQLPSLKKTSSNKRALNETCKRAVTENEESNMSVSRRKEAEKEDTGIVEENRRLRIINQHLQEQNQCLLQTLRRHESRDKELTAQLKESGCCEHMIIIQSLKKVIDSQLEKTIQLQKEIIISRGPKNTNYNDMQYKDTQYKDTHKHEEDNGTPSFQPSSPRSKTRFREQSEDSTEEGINSYIDYVDTFRQNKNKDIVQKVQQYPSKTKEGPFQSEEPPLPTLKKPLTIDPTCNSAQELLLEIDDCLDSLSRRKRQVR